MIGRPAPPEDLEDFWESLAAEALAATLDYRREVQPLRSETGHRVEIIQFRGVQGEALQGWLAFPEGARRLPSFLWLPPYGRESVLPDAYGTREGFTSLGFNFHGLPAFHQEAYVPALGYFAEGVETPETWIYRRLAQNALIALRVLQAQAEADEDRIGAAGLSQGGGMAVWLGAWSPIVKAVCADMPFLGCTWRSLVHAAYRYPLKELIDYADTMPLGLERVLNTVSYFDTVHQAERCPKPTLVSLGEKDAAVRPEYAEAIYNVLPGPKALIRYPGGHDWDPGMVDQNRHWLLAHLG